jgi:hypothetical protein
MTLAQCFEMFLEEFNATFGDLDKEHTSNMKILYLLSRIAFSCGICIEVQTIGLCYFMG